MALKFSPRFTIETAYPMMFSTDDIKYIEADIFNAISDKVYLPHSFADLNHMASREREDSSTRLNSYTSFPEGMHIIQRLEHLWAMETIDHPQDRKQR